MNKHNMYLNTFKDGSLRLLHNGPKLLEFLLLKRSISYVS